ncbi:MAG: hypothetical protein N2Z22_05975 [Turneriella sp.]|nr:hypothetical protein [Turneriella sp.]
MVFFAHCGQSPEKFIEKAQASLMREEHEAALLYMKNAYEVSLPKDFFITKRDQSFGFLRAAFGGQKILLTEKKTARRAFDEHKVLWLDRERDRQKKNSLPGKVREVSLAPGGLFAVFLQQPGAAAKECTIWLWQVEKNLMEKVTNTLCHGRPAVTDDGSVWYLADEMVRRRPLGTTQAAPDKGKRVARPLPKFVAYPYFYAAPGNEVWLVYGAAGNYRLYRVDGKVQLVSKEVASHRMYFLAESGVPGVFVGGAGNQQFMVLDPKHRTRKRLNAKNWSDAAFINDKVFYYLEEGILSYRNGKNETELPFWAEQLAIGVKDELLFLSSTGSAMRYFHRQVPAESLRIYEKTVEIDDSKS